MTETTRVDVLDLRHYSARQLRPLLEQEARVWEARLGWDYRSSIELLLQYLDSRILPGFVASIRGRICGLAFCVYEGNKAVIGDVYVSREIADEALVTETLLRHQLEMLNASPEIERIEAQLLLYDSGALEEPFTRLGFRLFPRLYQECRLNLGPAVPQEPAWLKPGLELRRWTTGFYQTTAELIHASYVGHMDAGINDQYRSLHGSLRFLHNIVRFPGCGIFEQSSSWIVRDRNSNSLVAAVLCSKIGPSMAHVTQLCVAPKWRGQQLGQHLMAHAMAHLGNQGYAALTLTVTEGNDSAVQLYNKLGFWTRHRFDAMVRDKAGSPFRLTPSMRERTGFSDGPPQLSRTH